MLLSRVADRLYWGARYIERAEDTARIVRAHGELTADLPAHVPVRWEPLVALVGSEARFTQGRTQRQHQAATGEPEPEREQEQEQQQGGRGGRVSVSGEAEVTAFLVADRTNPGSVTSCVVAARENLRTTRDTVPRDGWTTLNDLYLYVSAEADRGIDRRLRDRFLGRVIADSRRLDGVLVSSMTHDEAYVMWRLGRAVERADMTTRVLGVRAAALLSQREAAAGADAGGAGANDVVDDHDEVQWMGVLRSVSGQQMYQRAVRGPIEAAKVVEFLLLHDRFPRAVRALLREMRRALGELPDPGGPLDAVDQVEAALRDSAAASTDGAELDAAMDALQVAIAGLDRRITGRYLRVGS